MSRWMLKVHKWGDHPCIELNSDEKDAIIDAINVRLSAISIEEAYELLIMSYKEFESTCVDLTMDYMMREMIVDEKFWFHRARLQLNQRIMGLLTAGRAYREHLRSLSQISSWLDGNLNGEFAQHMGKLYSGGGDYELMESFRNYVQHHGMPVSGVTLGSSWDSDKTNIESGMKFFTELWINTDLLKSNRSKDTQNFEKIKQFPRWSLRPALKSYVEKISGFHIELRRIWKTDVNRCSETIKYWIEKYAEQTRDRDINSLALFEVDEYGRCRMMKYVLSTPDEWRAYLESINRRPLRATKIYVSTKATEEK